MRIKTITCHNVYNFGASLQAYALASYLKSLGHEVEIIDYIPVYLEHYKLSGSASGRYDRPFVRQIYNIAKFPGRLKARLGKRKKEYDCFTKKYLPVTQQRYSSNEELKRCPPQADVFFAGSDQIWNTAFPNGKDPAFYLDFVSGKAVKASYAASFATDMLDRNYETKVKEWLSRLDFISVRESTGVEIVRRLGIGNVELVLDPVFLFTADSWRKIEKDLKINESYILIYDFDQNESMSDFAVKYAKKHNCRIYSVFPCKCADRCFWNEGPTAFIYLIRNAEFVISNSFHATAFSLIFQRPFAVFNRNEKINTRMKDLIDCLGFSDRLVTKSNASAVIEQKTDIDFSFAEKELSRQISRSKTYINTVLESANHKYE